MFDLCQCLKKYKNVLAKFKVDCNSREDAETVPFHKISAPEN